MNYRESLFAELRINPEIKFSDAMIRFPGLTRSNYDRIRHQWRKTNGKKKKNLTKENYNKVS